MLDLIDIGVNLTHESFASDRHAVLARAAAAGVGRLIVTGTSVTASLAAAELSAAHPETLYATAGIHPHHASELDGHSIDALRRLAGAAKVVAIGECGLDYFRDFSPRDRQREAFAAQLELAAEIGLPVFLHQRDAHDDFVELLEGFRPRLAGAVAHCFTGGRRELADYLALDLHVGITGWICDERRGGELRDAVAAIPVDRVLVETDAPYLLPRDLRPAPAHRRNEPCYLPHVLSRLAAAMAQDVATLAAATTTNAERLFELGLVD
jgi:TatD DNase family protein